jgi:hypothetical protein
MKDFLGNELVEGDYVSYVVRHGSSVYLHVGEVVGYKLCDVYGKAVYKLQAICAEKEYNKWRLLKCGKPITLYNPTIVRVPSFEIPLELSDLFTEASVSL